MTMRESGFFASATVFLALGLPNAAWALWSPEPMPSADFEPLSLVAAPPLADGPKVPMGYTPPMTTGAQVSDPSSL